MEKRCRDRLLGSADRRRGHSQIGRSLASCSSGSRRLIFCWRWLGGSDVWRTSPLRIAWPIMALSKRVLRSLFLTVAIAALLPWRRRDDLHISNGGSWFSRAGCELLLPFSRHGPVWARRSQPTKPNLNVSNLIGPASGYSVVSRPLSVSSKHRLTGLQAAEFELVQLKIRSLKLT